MLRLPEESAPLIRNIRSEFLNDNYSINKRLSEHIEQLLKRFFIDYYTVINQTLIRPFHVEFVDPHTKDEENK